MFVRKSLVLVALLAFTISLSFSQVTQEKKIIVKKSDDALGAWLGIFGVQLKSVKTSVSSDKKEQTTTSGVTVAYVEQGSPAEKAGIKEDDIILELNGKKIENPENFYLLKKAKKGDKVKVLLLRGKENKTVTVELGERSESESKIIHGRSKRSGFVNMPRAKHFNFNFGRNKSFFGATLMKLNTELGEYFKSPTKKGMLVTKVKKESSSEKAGVKVGDVIVAIGKESIEDMHDIKSAVSDYKQGDKMEVSVIRKEKKMTLSIAISDKDIKRLNNNKNMFFFNGNKGMSFDFNFDMDSLNDFNMFDFDTDSLKFDMFDFDMDSLEFNIGELREQFKNFFHSGGKLRYFAPHNNGSHRVFKEFGKKYKISIDDDLDKNSLKKDLLIMKKKIGEEKQKNIRVKVKKLSDEELDDDEVVIIKSK
jgi:membrane-associated protease RseP (regulator of RpoE activity)